MREIVQEGASVLRKEAKPVPEELFGSPKLARIIADMTEALDREPDGVALAAPQIGVPYRIFIVREDRAAASPPNDQGLQDSLQGSTLNTDSQGRTSVAKTVAAKNETYINPEIVKTSRRRARLDEGCLSVRGVYGSTLRHERVTVRARRASGARFERGAGGIMAQIFEHEVDHLNGILFIDHAERLLRVEHAATDATAG